MNKNPKQKSQRDTAQITKEITETEQSEEDDYDEDHTVIDANKEKYKLLRRNR